MNDDLIRREDAVRTLNERYEKAHEYAISVLANGAVFQGIELVKAAMHVIEKVPAVDAVEVVRCKDCKHSRERDKDEQRYLIDGVLICTSIDATDDCCNAVWPDHYCSYGERREEDA